MRILMALLILFCVLCIVPPSLVFRRSSGLAYGTVITYHYGYGRLYALGAAVLSGVAFYGVYRRSPIAWKLGWLFLFAGAMDFIFEAWLGLIHQPYGWVGALGATVCVIAVTIYWGIWWQRHRDYFTPNGPPAGWSPDLTPLRCLLSAWSPSRLFSFSPP